MLNQLMSIILQQMVVIGAMQNPLKKIHEVRIPIK